MSMIKQIVHVQKETYNFWYMYPRMNMILKSQIMKSDLCTFKYTRTNKVYLTFLTENQP